MNTWNLRHTALAGLLAIGLSLPAFAAEQSDVGVAGTANKADLEKVFPAKPSYSPYVGRNFPTRPFFGDTLIHGRGCVRGAPRPKRRLPFCEGRRSHRVEWAADQTVPPTRLPGRGRPFGWLWILPPLDGRRPGTTGDTARPEVV